jgi:hypothetical protein
MQSNNPLLFLPAFLKSYGAFPAPSLSIFAVALAMYNAYKAGSIRTFFLLTPQGLCPYSSTAQWTFKQVLGEISTAQLNREAVRWGRQSEQDDEPSEGKP